MPIFDLDLPELQRYRPEVAQPADFDGFWAATIEETRGHELAATSVPVDNKLALVDTYDIRFSGFGGSPVHAWLHVPAGASSPLPTVVQYQGYSVGRGFPHSFTTWAQAGWAQFVMDTRSQGWLLGGGSRTADPSPAAGAYAAPGLLTRGITDPSDYYYRRVYADALRMLEVAQGHRLVDASRILVTGGSQGGGLAIAAAGLAPLAGIELVGAAPDVPFLCHFRRAVAITDAYPYQEITDFLAGWRTHEEAAYRTLSYFDGVSLARRASAPALFSVALMDRVCPPSTVFAAYHSYGGDREVDKRIEVYRHNEHEGGAGYQVDLQLSWFAERFAG